MLTLLSTVNYKTRDEYEGFRDATYPEGFESKRSKSACLKLDHTITSAPVTSSNLAISRDDMIRILIGRTLFFGGGTMLSTPNCND